MTPALQPNKSQRTRTQVTRITTKNTRESPRGSGSLADHDDPVRIGILRVLADCGSEVVTDQTLANALGKYLETIQPHLTTLANAGVLDYFGGLVCLLPELKGGRKPPVTWSVGGDAVR